MILTSTLFAIVLGASPLPGELWAFGGGGVILNRPNRVRINTGVEWVPFAKDAWGGLNEVTSSVAVLCTPDHKGHAGLQVFLGYGRPKKALWVNFEAGLGTVMGWTPGAKTTVFPTTPLASLRTGFGPVVMRVTGFIIGGHAHVFHHDFYAVTLEGFFEL